MDSKSVSSPLRTDEMVDILIVEDNETDMLMTMQALKEANLTNRIFVVRDGVEALDFLFLHG